MKSSTLSLFPALLLLLAGAAGAEISREDLKKALDKNPDLVLDVLRSNKKAAFEIINEAARDEQARRQQEQEVSEKKEFEESFKNPKKPQISEKTRMRGDRAAKYTLVEYSDFQCPYCSRGFQTVEALRKKYGPDLRFVYKNLPLPMHPQAMAAAQYFEAVTLQSPEKSWAFHDKMFENQAKLGEPFFKETAKALDLDVARLEKDAQSRAVKDRIEADVAEAKKFGFDGTPAFLLNGIPVRGAYPVEHFDSIIEKLALKK